MPVVGTPATAARAVDVITRSIAPTGYDSRNLFLRSEDFNNASWTKTAITVTTGVVAGPYAGTLADALSATAVSSSHAVVQGSIIGATVGNRYTISVYAKANTLNFLRIAPSTSHTGGATCTIYFDLTLGTSSILSAPAQGAVSSNMIAAMTNIGGGWWRCSVSYTFITTGAGSGQIFIGPALASGSGIYLGDATDGIYVWGAQFTRADTPPAYIRPSLHRLHPIARVH
jgi:hypothetical protein